MYGSRAWTASVSPKGVASPKARSEASLLAQRRRHMHPSFLRMGPATLCITCVLLVGFMAVLYLSQVGQVVAANHQLQDIRSEQAALERQNQDLVDTLTREQSPAYIAEQAQKMGLGPVVPPLGVNPKNLWVVQVSHLQEMGQGDGPTVPPLGVQP